MAGTIRKAFVDLRERGVKRDYILGSYYLQIPIGKAEPPGRSQRHRPPSCFDYPGPLRGGQQRLQTGRPRAHGGSHKIFRHGRVVGILRWFHLARYAVRLLDTAFCGKSLKGAKTASAGMNMVFCPDFMDEQVLF